MSKSQKAFIWIFGSSPKMTKKDNSVFSHPSVIPAPYRGTGQAPAGIQSSDSNTMKAQRAFTLIELLITITILAILGSAISIVLNPAELLAEARDSQRINDLESLRNSLSLTLIDNPSLFDSLSNTSIYLSLPSSSCLTNPLSGYTYICNATSLNLQKTDSTGWLPLSLTNLPVFPIDPVNSSSSSLYYAFVPDLTNHTFVLTSLLESEKYLKLSALKDGGTDPSRIEEGNPTLWTSASGLVGYWPMDEGSGSVAGDLSGNNINGALAGSPAWNTESSCKRNSCLYFNGTNYVSFSSTPLSPSSAKHTMIGWIKPGSLAAGTNIFVSQDLDYLSFHVSGNKPFHSTRIAYIQRTINGATTVSANNWYMISGVYDGNRLSVWLNDREDAYLNDAGTGTPGSTAFTIGRYAEGGYSTTGYIDEVRIYNRALSAAEIQSIYNSQK